MAYENRAFVYLRYDDPSYSLHCIVKCRQSISPTLTSTNLSAGEIRAGYAGFLKYVIDYGHVATGQFVAKEVNALNFLAGDKPPLQPYGVLVEVIERNSDGSVRKSKTTRVRYTDAEIDDGSGNT